ncbi:NAD(P)/FAD-dependent oxidoreductase [Prauserella muralis]|uniref:Pyridine nucleotide-disulfide oxidoreductase n=1 Tax=Prauserella muralis TaxID=588067 RepID=A0A2V4AG45_9PSEU|nr:FAD-dependent oxidoreductase [Prauserella muralis]PXY18809.1 pyridine nucleotide-disulfide oxidoreductase [Prauserella muralis]TWE28660.1 3-phenylpropionate/trans-cinnamate dioxygenase ferredoxin reductase subunit [Prauserella muralis]
MCPAPSSDGHARAGHIGARVVVVGAGHAGVQVADALRTHGHRGCLTIVGDEPVLPYQRPPLSKEHLAPAEGVAALPLRAERHFAEHRITLLTGVTVTALDRRARTVALSDGGDVPYDALVLATGAVNRALTVPGADLTGIHALRTLSDADTLRTALLEAGSVLVVGAGFIGLEFAAAARRHAARVTVLEAAERPLARAVSAETASYLADAHRDAGTDLRCGEAVARFVGDNGRVRGAIGTTGAEYEADLVLVGIGVEPRVELALRAGLDVADGIVVDEHLRTADPAIYAVGDCANHPNSHAGARLRLESVQNASGQARHVASVILGARREYAELPWFWSHQGELRLQIAGVRLPGDDSVVLGDPATGRFSVCCLRGGRLVAVESVNRPADHMAARRLLAAGPVPAPENPHDPAFSLKRFAQELVPAP